MLFSSYGIAQALTGPSPRQFDALYTTDSNGSRTEKNSFSFSETPYLYAKLPEVETGDLTSLITDWTDGASINDSVEVRNANAVSEFWLTPGDWDSVKHEGNWDIKTFFIVDKPNSFAIGDLFGGSEGTPQITRPYRFSVTTPEPVSSALFLMGSGILGLKARRKKKTAMSHN